MMTTTPLLLLTLFTLQIFSCEENCDDCCWQRCFSKPKMYSSEYARFHSLVTAIRAKKEEIGAGGTAFLFDQTTTDPNICLYQKNLASLIALTMPVSDVCNPFFLSRYATNFAWHAWSWQCKDRCEAATTISNTPTCTLPPASVQNSVNVGCANVNFAINNPSLSCSKNVVKGRSMVVALANSDFGPWQNCMGFIRAVVGVEDANVASMNTFVSDPFLAFDFKNMDGFAALEASRQLLKCINKNCCNGASHTPVKREADKGKATIHIAGEEPKTMSVEEVAELIANGIEPPTTHKPTTIPKPKLCRKQSKRCTRKGGKCYYTKPRGCCKSLGRCDKRGTCICYKCQRCLEKPKE